MIQLLNNKQKLLYAILFFLTSAQAFAVPGEILEDDIASSADTSVLMAEVKLFETIRKGIAVLIAQCEVTEVCVPAVNREELKRIIDKLDTRIKDLSQRLDETGEEDLKEIVGAYTDTRAAYFKFINRVGIITTATQARGIGEISTGNSSDRAADFDIFKDADDPLTDD